MSRTMPVMASIDSASADERVDGRLPCPPACPSGRRAAGPSSPPGSTLSAPITRPVLARTSSAASGIALLRHDRGAGGELVAQPDQADLRRGPDHDLLGEARQMHRRDRGGRSVSMTKSRAETASSELRIGPSNSSSFAVMSRSIGNDVPASAAAPSGELLSLILRVVEAVAVALRHLDIGEQMMAERHRLRALQMREARHHGRGVLERLLGERALIVAEQRMDVVDPVAHPQPEVGRDLVVARARGVQPAGRLRRSARRAGSRRSYECLPARA